MCNDRFGVFAPTASQSHGLKVKFKLCNIYKLLRFARMTSIRSLHSTHLLRSPSHWAPSLPYSDLQSCFSRIHPSVSHSLFQVAQLYLHLSCCSSFYSFPPTLHWCVFCHPSRESYVTSPSPPAPSFSSSPCSCLSGGTQVHSSGLH